MKSSEASLLNGDGLQLPRFLRRMLLPVDGVAPEMQAFNMLPVGFDRISLGPSM
jgi:hypothetical protein